MSAINDDRFFLYPGGLAPVAKAMKPLVVEQRVVEDLNAGGLTPIAAITRLAQDTKQTLQLTAPLGGFIGADEDTGRNG